MLKFQCPNCNETIITKFLKQGETGKCRFCGSEFVVPENAVETDEKPKFDKPVPPSPKKETAPTATTQKADEPSEVKTDDTNLRIIGGISGFVFIVCFFAFPMVRGCKGGQLIELGLESDKSDGQFFGILLIIAVIAAVVGSVLYFIGRYKQGAISGDIALVATILAAIIGEIKLKSIEAGGWIAFLALAVLASAPTYIKPKEIEPEPKIQSKQKCPSCGEPLEAKSKFCPACGNKLDECPSCGATLDINNKFCPECGKKLDEPAK